MFTSKPLLVRTARRLLTAMFCLVSTYNSHGYDRTNAPVQMTVQPDLSEGVHTGDLRVSVTNVSGVDLLFRSDYLPWEFNAGGIDFILYREDGTVIAKTPLIADPIVRKPALLKRGKQLTGRMSLLVYYSDLPTELALHDVKVKWSWLPRPNDLASTNILKGEFRLGKLTPSK